MELERALGATFRNFSTLFLVVFVLLLPFHLLYGWIFQDVLAVRDLHPAIAGFPESRQVRGVGQTDVEQARLWFWVLVALEVALLPVMVKVCHAVLRQDGRAEVTSVPAALRALRTPRSEQPGRVSSGTIAAASAIALSIAIAAELTLRMVADFLPDALAFVALAIASAAGRACGIPFLAVALAGGASAEASSREVPELY